MSDLSSASISDSRIVSQSSQSSSSPQKWLYLDLPLVPYVNVLELQRNLVQARIAGPLNANVVILVEHPPIFTLGRNASREHLLVSEDFLNDAAVPLVQCERGGEITWHGPGQLVVYPIVHLRKSGIRASEFVRNLEEVMIRIAAQWGVTAGRDPRNRGVWVGNNKLGSIGIAVRRGVSFHGFALNACPSLEFFEWIRPCGLEGIGTTSIERESKKPVGMQDLHLSARRRFEEVFGITLERMGENG